MKTETDLSFTNYDKPPRNIFLEKIREICLQHNGLCDAGDNVMIVDTNKFNIIERKK